MERVPRLLTSDDLAAQLVGLPGWELQGGRLVRTVRLADFAAALDLVVRVGEEAEAMNHHPDVDVRYDSVRFGALDARRRWSDPVRRRARPPDLRAALSAADAGDLISARASACTVVSRARHDCYGCHRGLFPT